jgi:hypothetical protein
MYHKRTMPPTTKGKASNPKKSRDRHTKQRRKRPTIGYLAHRVGDNVSQAIWTGVVDAAREQDVNLICFAGDRLRDPDGRTSPDNVAYDLINPQVVDGLVS